jgi:hypothetical protein
MGNIRRQHDTLKIIMMARFGRVVSLGERKKVLQTLRKAGLTRLFCPKQDD